MEGNARLINDLLSKIDDIDEMLRLGIQGVQKTQQLQRKFDIQGRLAAMLPGHAQRLHQLSGQVDTINQMLAMERSREERLQLLLTKSRIQDQIQEIQNGGATLDGPQTPGSISLTPSVADQMQTTTTPRTPADAHNSGGQQGAATRFSGASVGFQTPAVPDDPFGPAISGQGRRRTMNSMGTSDTTTFDSSHAQMFQQNPPSSPMDGQTIQALSRESATESQDPDYAPNARFTPNKSTPRKNASAKSTPQKEKKIEEFPLVFDKDKNPTYQLIVWRNGRMVELACCFCGGTQCALGMLGKPRTLWGVEGLARHIVASHKKELMDRGLDPGKKPSLQWVVPECVLHELTRDEEQMANDGTYKAREKRVETEAWRKARDSMQSYT
ncbi:hypothetical protein PRZ48_010064 [Zasmidium cellare]|uniref:Uncharacterized protein n=1 Tax=Zasmidium cellare TaxID=395010 RepID=A0ABR0EEB7_ZASCE|nr:hypothetical protein PRZ48_010064 [Zasmidium cellare]